VTSTYRHAAIPLAAFLLMGAFWGAWAALVPEIQLRTAASPPALGGALLFAGLGALPAMLLTGRLWSRFGSALVGLTLVLFGLAAVLPALATNVVLLAGAMALVGASSGALDVAMNSHISDIEARSRRHLMYLAHALFSLAVLLSSLSVGLLRDAGVEPLPVLGSVALAFLLVALPAVAVDRRRSAQSASPVRVGLPSVGGLRRTIALLGVLCAIAFLIEDALLSWSALHLERTLGASAIIGSAGPGLFAGAMFIGRSLGQLLARRFSEGELLVGSGVLAAAGILIAAWAPSAEVALPGLVVAGAGISLAAPALFSRAGRLGGPGGRGAAISTLTVMGYLGFVIGPPTVGVVAGLADLRLSFTVLACLALVLAAASRVTLRSAQRTAEVDELPPVSRA
jgi:predicted MFS family arabinose efflux permease